MTFLSVDYKGDTIRIKYSFGESNGSVLGTLEVSRKAHVQLKKKINKFCSGIQGGAVGGFILNILNLVKASQNIITGVFLVGCLSQD